MFDPAWYLMVNANVSTADIQPLYHMSASACQKDADRACCLISSGTAVGTTSSRDHRAIDGQHHVERVEALRARPRPLPSLLFLYSFHVSPALGCPGAERDARRSRRRDRRPARQAALLSRRHSPLDASDTRLVAKEQIEIKPAA